MSTKEKRFHRRTIRLQGYDYTQSGAYFVTICCQDRACRFGQVENGEMVLNKYGEIAHNEWVRLSERYPHAMFDVFQIMPNHIHGIIVVATAVAVGVRAGLAPALNNTTAVVNRATARVAPTISHDDTTVVAHDDVTADVNDNETAVANIETDIRATARVAPTISHNNTNADANRATARVAPTMTTMPMVAIAVGNIVGAYKSLVANACLEIYKQNNETMGKLWQRNYYEHIIRNEQSYQRIAQYIVNNPANWDNDSLK